MRVTIALIILTAVFGIFATAAAYLAHKADEDDTGGVPEADDAYLAEIARSANSRRPLRLSDKSIIPAAPIKGGGFGHSPSNTTEA